MRKVAATLILFIIAGCSDSEGDLWDCESRFYNLNKSINFEYKSADEMQATENLMNRFISTCMVQKGYSFDVEASQSFLNNIYHNPDSLLSCHNELMTLRDPSWYSTCHQLKSENSDILLRRGAYWVKPLTERLKIDFN